MRKTLLSLFVISFYFTPVFPQESLFQFSKNYFRSDPFVGNFNSFLDHLLNDPSLFEKELKKRTDTSLFYFSGIYKDHNPFFFKPKKLQIQLQQVSVNYGDSLANDTIFIYQLIAYAEDTEKGKAEIKKEFEKIHRVFNKKFYDSNYQDVKSGVTINGVLHKYFVDYSPLSPASTLWIKQDNEVVLNITLRFKASENRAVLAASLDNP